MVSLMTTTIGIRDALTRAIGTAHVRVTGEPLDETTAQQIVHELLSGDVLDGLATVEASDRAVRIVTVEKVIPADQRRPAPTLEDVWRAHPELHERQLAHVHDTDPDQRKWALIPQPLYSPDLPADELPNRIIRQCCQNKTCGGTDLYLNRVDTPTGVRYQYLRSSNDEQHYGFGAPTVAELVKQLNNPEWWPNGWDTGVFEWAAKGQDVDFNAPSPA